MIMRMMMEKMEKSLPIITRTSARVIYNYTHKLYIYRIKVGRRNKCKFVLFTKKYIYTIRLISLKLPSIKER